MKQITLIALLALSFSAQALTLKEKKQMGEWRAYLASESESYVKTTKDKCGIDIPVTMEDAFATPFMTASANAASYCDATRSAISTMCNDATSKAEIVKKVKKITCKLGKEKEKTFKFNGTELVFTVGLNASNLDEAVTKFLEDNL